MLVELISLDQTTFLPMRFILDNVFVAHVAIDIVKSSSNTYSFLKWISERQLTR